LNDYLKPLLTTLIDKFPKVPLRFLVALALTFLQRYINKNPFKKSKFTAEGITLKKNYELVCQQYPALEGKVYAYDAAFKFLLKPHWNEIQGMVADEVAKLRKQLEEEKEVMRKEVEAKKISEKRQVGATEYYKNQIAVKLFELFNERFHQPLTKEREEIIIKNVSVLLRRMAMEIWGHVSAETAGPIKEAFQKFLWPEIVNYPIIVAKGIVVMKGKYYIPNQRTFDEVWTDFQTNPEIIEQYKEKFFDQLLQGFTGGANYEIIAKNLVAVLKKAKDP
jgi:hypothetical protein